MQEAAVSAVDVERIACAVVPDLPHATWSNVLRVGPELIVSGQTAHPATRNAASAGAPLGAYEQAMVVLRKIQALAEAAGGGIHNILKLTVYVTDIADKDEVGRARRDFFRGQAYPASTLVAVSALVFPELRVEIDATVRLDADLRSAAPAP
ncbi:RidA family protein [Variovorax dokdonensis]|uniref:RidA family protein n=1 Tax=Variovorax dokdonensis TaxID=344883 RepID=A0ABT7NCZ5_9BURK|nr:RidA family protein [Variovorax dokdonensis]MDM0045789.1 RidA family protein [Variovorax dokdonensis]